MTFASVAIPPVDFDSLLAQMSTEFGMPAAQEPVLDWDQFLVEADLDQGACCFEMNPDSSC
jgi:hypothetical protein